MKTIPKQIKNLFVSEMKQYGDRIYHLGKESGVDYYSFAYPEDLDICKPTVYGFDGSKMYITNDIEATRLVSLFLE